MVPRHRWVGFRVHSQNGEINEFELNDRGQLMEPPPRQQRRRFPYYDGLASAEPPRPRVARLLTVPDFLGSDAASPIDAGCDETGDEAYCCSEEASPGPYTGQWDESSFNDSFSFGWSLDVLVTPFMVIDLFLNFTTYTKFYR
jgi:hypothetical protein